MDKIKNIRQVKFIDLFAGIGGMRKGFELACQKRGLSSECVFTSEIKEHAREILKQNHPLDFISGDITLIDEKTLPDFDFLLAGFPCQAFSSAGKRLGFFDARGNLFFSVSRILKAKKPYGFLLENVDGIVNHDKRNPNDKIGQTLKTILKELEDIGYKVTWKVLNAKDFGVAQDRKRIYIVGTKTSYINLSDYVPEKRYLKDVLKEGLEVENNDFIDNLLTHYSLGELKGKSIKDKRGGSNNIHSWDLELKGHITKDEKTLMNLILTERRRKKWASELGISWMDGMPLTYEQIKTFYDHPNLKTMLDDLLKKKYLKYEYPKKKVDNKRILDKSLPKGYNIVAGKMSFPVSKILDRDDISPTLVAMDMDHLYVIEKNGLRTLSLREGLDLFAYPSDFKFNIEKKLGYDLLGNTVVVSVIAFVAGQLLKTYCKEMNINIDEIDGKRSI